MSSEHPIRGAAALMQCALTAVGGGRQGGAWWPVCLGDRQEIIDIVARYSVAVRRIFFALPASFLPGKIMGGVAWGSRAGLGHIFHPDSP